MSANRIIEVAKKYVGQTETLNNSGFTDKSFEQKMKDVGWSKSLSWCAFFTELVWKEAMPEKYTELDKLFSGSATATYKNFDLANGWTCGQLPKIGSLAVWRYGNGWQGHIGVVIESNTTTFKSVEGNTNDKGGREGYIVAVKNRVLKGKYQPNGLNLIGFIYPPIV